MQKKAALTLDKATLEALGKIESVAGKIKFLSAQKVERADIARTLTVVLGREVKYQWVKNVLDKEDMKKSA